jgi:hypothetical protein
MAINIVKISLFYTFATDSGYTNYALQTLSMQSQMRLYKVLIILRYPYQTKSEKALPMMPPF